MNSDFDNYKHIGVYAFRKETLLEFSKMEKTVMEKKEKIECLRYIENGKNIVDSVKIPVGRKIRQSIKFL